jgi:hypothetical protein
MTAPPGKPVWQQVLCIAEGDQLRANNVSPYYGGMPDVVQGFVTMARHTAHLRGSEALLRVLRMDYPGSPFGPSDPVYALRFTTDSVASVFSTDKPMARSMGREGGADLGYGPPYTGNGFTGTAEFTIPEFWMVDGVLDPLAELWYVPPTEGERLAAVLTASKEWVGVAGFDH